MSTPRTLTLVSIALPAAPMVPLLPLSLYSLISFSLLLIIFVVCFINNFFADMKAQRVFDPLVGKIQQILLANQVVKMILKIDDVIRMGPEEQ